jgi:hypothetical protein
MAHLSLESIHRAFDAMPVVVMLDVDRRRIELFANVPSFRRLLDGEADEVASGGDVAVDQHELLQ